MMTGRPKANVLATVTGRGARRSCRRRPGQGHGRSAVKGLRIIRLVSSGCAQSRKLEFKTHPHMLQQGARHLSNPVMARPSVDHRHRRLHGAGAESVQGLLAGLLRSVGRRFAFGLPSSPNNMQRFKRAMNAKPRSRSGGVPGFRPCNWSSLVRGPEQKRLLFFRRRPDSPVAPLQHSAD
jgi:hypothetical protein